MIKLFFLPAGIPIIKYRIFRDCSKDMFQPLELEEYIGKTQYEKYFSLCDICGSQITDRRRKHTCSNECTQKRLIREYNSERKASFRGGWWNTFKGEALSRDNYTCQECGRKRYDGKGVNTILEVHHIIPLCCGGTNEEENLITLCPECHKKKHKNGYGKPTDAALQQINKTLFDDFEKEVEV